MSVSVPVMLVESDGTSSLYISLWEGVLVLKGCEIFCEIFCVLSFLLLGFENISLWEGVVVLKVKILLIMGISKQLGFKWDLFLLSDVRSGGTMS